MPNRILKESICTSDTIAQLDPEEEIFFYRLLVMCDDYGRMDARSAILRAKGYPLKIDKVKESDINKWLNKLVKVGLIHLYEVDNKPYLYVTTWEKHQQVRAKKSKYPSPDEAQQQSDSTYNHMISDDNICPRESEYESESKSEYESEDILSPETGDTTSQTQQDKVPYQEIANLYNDICQSLPKIKQITNKRKRSIKTAWHNMHENISAFEQAFRKAETSDFLSGRNGKWTGCNFDWLINSNNLVKVLEGTYDNRAAPINDLPENVRNALELVKRTEDQKGQEKSIWEVN